MMPLRSLLVCTSVLGSTLALAVLVGCGPTEGERFRDLTKQINTLKTERIQLQDELAGRDAKIAAFASQLQNLRSEGLAAPAPVFDVRKIEILDITSGTDIDGLPGDDGVAVYFRPIDQDGEAIKRGGGIRVKLLDNANLGAPKLLGVRVDNDPKQVRKLWYGLFWTDYYKIVVPFAPNAELKPGQEIDVHVTFRDWLTGLEHTARTAVTISRIKA